MKPGDLVRVTITRWDGGYEAIEYVKLGLLISYQKWEKIATVLVEGERKRYRAECVTLAGRRDPEILSENLDAAHVTKA